MNDTTNSTTGDIQMTDTNGSPIPFTKNDYGTLIELHTKVTELIKDTNEIKSTTSTILSELKVMNNKFIVVENQLTGKLSRPTFKSSIVYASLIITVVAGIATVVGLLVH